VERLPVAASPNEFLETADGAQESLRTRLRRLFLQQRERIQQLDETLDARVRELVEQVSAASDRSANQDELAARLDQLEMTLTGVERERDRALAARRAGESLLKEARQAILNAAQERDELQTQLDRVQADLRQRNAENAELAARLAQASPRRTSVEAFNWEEQKRRLLMELDADNHSPDERALADRQRIEDAIRVTDEAVEVRDREIAELKQQLAERATRTNPAAEAILNRDEIVLEERRNLARLQQQCREKLRQSEVAISLERAKLARDRSELQEKLRLVEATRALQQDLGSGKRADAGSGRWLARLGLSDE